MGNTTIHRRIKWKCQSLKRTIIQRFCACDWSNIKVSFIISTGRTGTKFLAEFLRENFRGVDARHEPTPDMFNLGRNYLLSRISFSEAVRRFRHDRQAFCHTLRNTENDCYIECNNNLGFLVPIIQELFAEKKIVYIVRDGRDFVRSVYSRTTVKDGRAVLVMTDDDPRRRLAATDFPDDPYYSKWANMSRIERISWYWVKVNQIILDSLAKEKDVMTIKFEDVFDKAKNYEGMWKIIDFLELKDRMLIGWEDMGNKMMRKVNWNREYRLPHWKDWGTDQKRQFVRMAGGLMSKLGYRL